jgi:hypothetical protein
VKSREGFSGRIPTNILCKHFILNHAKISQSWFKFKSKLNQTNTIFTNFRELTIKIQTWHYEIQKSILVNVRLAQKYGISKLIFSHVCFDTQNSLDNTSKITTKVHQIFFFFFFNCIASLSFLIDPCIKC